MFGQVVHHCVLVFCKQWCISSCLTRVTKQSRKGILLFSSVSLVKWISVFCLMRCLWNSRLPGQSNSIQVSGLTSITNACVKANVSSHLKSNFCLDLIGSFCFDDLTDQ